MRAISQIAVSCLIANVVKSEADKFLSDQAPTPISACVDCGGANKDVKHVESKPEVKPVAVSKVGDLKSVKAYKPECTDKKGLKGESHDEAVQEAMDSLAQSSCLIYSDYTTWDLRSSSKDECSN